jgi:hypothetical protein
MTAANNAETVAVSESDADTTAVEAPLFLAPPPTEKASARAALLAEAREAANDNRSAAPVLRFSAGG